MDTQGFSPTQWSMDQLGVVEKEWRGFAKENDTWQGRLVVPFKALYNGLTYSILNLIMLGEAIVDLVKRLFSREPAEVANKDAVEMLLSCSLQVLLTPISILANLIYGSYIGISETPEKLPRMAPGTAALWWFDKGNRASIGL